MGNDRKSGKDLRRVKEKRAVKFFLKLFVIMLGAVLASIGLEIFLIPNNLIDGGVVGISIMLSYVTKVPLAVFLIVLNIPFLIIGYLHIGKTFCCYHFVFCTLPFPWSNNITADARDYT